MIDQWLPLIGAFMIGVITTVVSVATWLWNRKRKMKKAMDDMFDMETDIDG